jgi:beta-glucosidase
MVGLTSVAESEGFDRDSLDLPEQHDALVSAVAAVAKRTVVVLSLGAPVSLPWRDDVDAIVVAHLGGQASGGAVSDFLLGVVEPTGRLTETWFAQQADIAADLFFPGGLNQVEYREGVFVGYRHSTTAGIQVQFPFGHGLGYGTTEWSKASVSSDSLSVGDYVTVSVEVANTGNSATSDVVQVYAHDRSGVVLRPRRELVGFAHVSLAPGERRMIEVTVSADDLSFWDIRTHAWALPTGILDLEIGRSAHDIESTVTLNVAGDVTDSAEPPATPAISASDADFVARLGHEIPTPRSERPFTRESTVGDLSGTFVGRALRAGLRKAMPISEADKDDPGTVAMMERSVDELPLRGLAQMSGGQVTWKHVDAILALANRRPLRAVRALFARR